MVGAHAAGEEAAEHHEYSDGNDSDVDEAEVPVNNGVASEEDCKQEGTERRRPEGEENEELVVVQADAVVDPRAVVIVAQSAALAHRTVVGSGRLDQVASVADGVLVTVRMQVEGELLAILWGAAGIRARRAEPAAQAERGQNQETTDANDEDEYARARPVVAAHSGTWRRIIEEQGNQSDEQAQQCDDEH